MSDQVLRAISNSGAFRVLAAVVTDAANEARAKQQMSPPVVEVFSRLLGGVVLIRPTLNPSERMQIHVEHMGLCGDLVVDAWPDGMVRGYVTNPVAGAGREGVIGVISPPGSLGVSRSRLQSGGAPYQSHTRMVSGRMTDELELYLFESEQISSAILLDVSQNEDGSVAWAGGVLVQLLPEADHEQLKRLLAHLESLGSLREAANSGSAAEIITGALPTGHEVTIVGEHEVEFRCKCDDGRVLASLRTLGADELQSVIDQGEALEIGCGFCGQEYAIETDRVAEVLASLATAE